MEQHGVDLNTVQKRYEGKSYDVFIKNYLSTFDPRFLAQSTEALHKAAQVAALKGGGNVVELAVGSGRNIAAGYFTHPNLNVLGLDISEGMLAEARKKVDELELNNVRLENGDVRDAVSKVGKRSSDLTVMTYGLCVTPEPEAVLQEIAELTKPGGLVLIMDYVFAQNKGIQKEQESIAPIGKTQGIRFYESRQLTPLEDKEVTDYAGRVMAMGPDKQGHAIVWDPTFDLRSLVRSEFEGKFEALAVLESEKDSLQSNMLFLGRKR